MRLGLFALIVGILALFGTPNGGETVTINPREMASIVASEVDHVTVRDLADWIIKGQDDLRLLDLRSAEAYAQYHVPGAENVALTALIDYPLYRNEKIVLYSDGGIHSAQAWFLLQAKNFRGTYILLGGLNEWKDEILFPTVPMNATPDQLAEFQVASAVSTYFGGSPRSAADGAASAAPVQMPKVAMPTTAPVKARNKRKAKEGC
jgi:rhodanese-related sulfurtransferase